MKIYDCKQARATMDNLLTRAAEADFSELELHLILCGSCGAAFTSRKRLTAEVKRAVQRTAPAPATLRRAIINLTQGENCR